ncbi:MAG: CPBP family glutamic-type intramembrane protease [Oscillospiraceae bacterium]
MEKRRPAKVCSRIGLALFLMLVVWLAVVNGLSALIKAQWPSLLGNAWVVWLVNDIPLYLLGMPLFLLVVQGIPENTERPRYKVPVGAGRWLGLLAFCLGSTYAISMVVNVVLTALQGNWSELLTEAEGWMEQMPRASSALEDMLMLEGGFLPNLLFGACVPALGEEFLFRYMLRRKMAGCGDKTYVLFSGLCFAVFHVNVSQMFYAFFLGALFAWLYLATGNIWLPVSLHFAVNVTGLSIPTLAMVLMRYEAHAISLLLLLLMVAMILGLIALAIVLFARYFARVMATMASPTEPGWPHRPAAPQQISWERPKWPADPTAWDRAHAYAPWGAAYGQPHAPYGQPYAPYGGGAPAALPSYPVQPYAANSAWPPPPAYVPGPGMPVWQPPAGAAPPGPGGMYHRQKPIEINATRHKSAARVVLLNVGMVLYLAVALVATVVNLLSMMGVLVF